MKRAPAGLVPIVAVDRTADQPLYRQIYERYRAAIVEGRLRAGERLPSTRTLAAELAVSRIPVLGAFEQLLAEGYVEARVGAGTFVARSLPGERLVAATAAARRRPAVLPRSRVGEVARAVSSLAIEAPVWTAGSGAFRTSEPALDELPRGTWAKLLARHARGLARASLGYGDPMGYPPLREVIASYLRTSRGVMCEPEQILVTSGSQQGLALAARVLLDPGAPVAFEEPGYGGARDAFMLVGARIVPVPVDGDGLDVSALDACSPAPCAVYVTPSHQYPLGTTMSAGRRLRLLEWARAAAAWIVEDDYDSEYRYESAPVSALQGLDRDGLVVYVGTFSKVLFPALRLGYVVVPPSLVARFARAREAQDVFPAVLPQAVVADFVGEGHFARHLRRMRALYRERRSALVEALGRQLGDAVAVLGAEAGMHLVTVLRDRAGDLELARRAAARGVWAMPLSTCYAQAPRRHGFVLGFASTPAHRMAAAVSRLRAATAL